MRQRLNLNPLSALILIIVLTSVAVHAEAQPTDFRQARWGMSRGQVMGVEKKAEFVAENEEVLIYKGTLAGFDVSISYRFVSGQLVRGMYEIRQTHNNRNDYIVDYYELKTLLITKYGLPTFTDIQWKNDLYKDKLQDWGLAVSLGHLAYITMWVTDSTEIALMLFGNNNKISHGITYDSLDLKLLSEESKEKQALDDL